MWVLKDDLLKLKHLLDQYGQSCQRISKTLNKNQNEKMLQQPKVNFTTER